MEAGQEGTGQRETLPLAGGELDPCFPYRRLPASRERANPVEEAGTSGGGLDLRHGCLRLGQTHILQQTGGKEVWLLLQESNHAPHLLGSVSLDRVTVQGDRAL